MHNMPREILASDSRHKFWSGRILKRILLWREFVFKCLFFLCLLWYNFCMENYREIVVENLVKFRKQKKWTQVEFAEKLNYSNKAVSRWEKGEVIPDVETLAKIAQIYDIELIDIFKKQSSAKVESTKNKEAIKGTKLTITLLAIFSVWVVATIFFVVHNIIADSSFWQTFLWAVPASFLVATIFSSIWAKGPLTLTMISFLMWTLLVSIYVQFLQYNLWIIFIIGVPIQICIGLWGKLYSLHKKRVELSGGK